MNNIDINELKAKLRNDYDSIQDLDIDNPVYMDGLYGIIEEIIEFTKVKYANLFDEKNTSMGNPEDIFGNYICKLHIHPKDEYEEDKVYGIVSGESNQIGLPEWFAPVLADINFICPF